MRDDDVVVGWQSGRRRESVYEPQIDIRPRFVDEMYMFCMCNFNPITIGF